MRFNFIEPEIGQISKKKMQPASYIRKSIRIEKPIIKATLHMTALGVYKGYFNGKELGSQILMPGFTNYRARVQYQSFDVTEQVRIGENVIGAVVGDGWYRGSLGIQSKRNFYGSKIKFACILELQDENGTRTILTDESWKASQDGPIRVNDIKTFETVDMTIDFDNWNNVGFDDGKWHNCIMANYDGKVIPQEGEMVLEHERFDAKIIQTPDGNKILDFGQNLSGHVEFKVTGRAGTKVTLTMGETLDEHGNFTLKNLQAEGGAIVSGTVGQKLTYILKEGTQIYKSLFLVSGYRFVKLENWPEEVKEENFKSIAVYSDLKMTGDFSCSNQLVTDLMNNVRWSLKSNFIDIPTDCPTRERAGWSGDINVFCETANYLTDARQFLHKWLHDFQSLQKPNGSLPYIIPEISFMKYPDNSAGWSDGIANIPMTLYRFYDDKTIIEEVYPTVKAYVEFNLKRARRKNWRHVLKTGKHYKYILDTGFQWGEWLEPGSVMVKDSIKGIITPDEEVATAWLYHTVNQLSEMAGILGIAEDQKTYANIANNIKRAYHKEFLKDGKIISNRQCRYVRPVAMGLLDGKEAQETIAVLNEMCIKNNYKIGTGFLTTYKILPVLCDFGYVDTAYKILENMECPGWLYEVNKGATTTWENWLGINKDGVPVDSHNHYAPGSVVAWMFSYCAGIKPMEPGFSKIQIKPIPGGSLTWAKAWYHSCKGDITSEWRIEEGRFNLLVEIPEGISCEVILPDGSSHIPDSGISKFACNVKPAIF